MAEGIQKLLSKEEIASLRNLEIGSRFTVEGRLQGAHKSPLKGFSIEFADYRPYVKGDDIKHLDWKVFARNERLYVRQYEQECNLRVYMLVDGSASMRFGHDRLSKYRYACRLAAALAYVTVQQQDSVGLTLFDRHIRAQLPARSSREHLRLLGDSLEQHEPANETDVAETLHRLAQSVQRRALVVLFSDMLDDLGTINKALAHFRRRKHDVIVYHVLDPAEINFPFHDIGNFQDMETGRNVITNPREIRHAYQEAIQEFLFACQKICAGLDIDYALSTTDVPPTEFLRRHLARRSRTGR